LIVVESDIQLSEHALDRAVESLQPRFVLEGVGSVDFSVELDESFLQQRPESLDLIAA
jgi:hypothetical protein